MKQKTAPPSRARVSNPFWTRDRARVQSNPRTETERIAERIAEIVIECHCL